MREIVQLGSIATIKGGKRLPKNEELHTSKTEHPYIRARDIGDGKITFDQPVYISKELALKLSRYTVNEKDLCITIVGANVGDVGIVPPHLHGANLTENAVKIIGNGQTSQDYLKYALNSNYPQAQMKVLANGAAQPKLGIYK